VSEELPGGRDEESPSELEGKRTLGPVASPGSRYSIIVGLIFLALVVVAFVHSATNRDTGTLGIESEDADLPLPEFAVPTALSDIDADANLFQDDCETSELPCPGDAQRTPACRVQGAEVIRVCDYFDLPLVISFWFARGTDCENQQDIVNVVAARYRGRVNFLSIDIRDDRDEVRDLVRDRGWTMPVGYDRDGALSTLYRVGVCPTFAYAFPGGILHDAGIGELSPTELEQRVTDLLRASRRRAAGSR
jgi:hypothetical protein